MPHCVNLPDGCSSCDGTSCARYINLHEAEYKKASPGAGLPEFLAELLANSDTGVSKGALFDDGKQLSKLIGRPTTPLAEVVKKVL